MDKENKYYNVIESLVKKHRKFPGYEAILDDIVNDVYAHSEVILSSIDNESVIESYLEKVISTSIITVPKKMKFNNAAKPRVISNTQISNIEVSPSADMEQNGTQLVTNDIQELNITNSDEQPEELAQIEEYIDETGEINSDDNLSEESVDISVEDGDNSTDILSFSQNIGVEKADPNLVDKMINSIGNDSITETIDLEEEIDLNEETDFEGIEVAEDTEDEIVDENLVSVDDSAVASSNLADIDTLEELSVDDDPLVLDLGFETEETDNEVILENIDDIDNIDDSNGDEYIADESVTTEISDASVNDEDSIDLSYEEPEPETMAPSEELEFEEDISLSEDEEQQTSEQTNENINSELQLGFEEDEPIKLDGVRPEEISFSEDESVQTDEFQQEIISSGGTDVIELDTEISINESEPNRLSAEEIPADILSESSGEVDSSEEILNENTVMDKNIFDIDDSGIETLSDDNELMDFSSEQYDFGTDSVESLTETDDIIPVDTEDVLNLEEPENDIVGEELGFANDDGEINESDSIMGANAEFETLNEEFEASELEQDGIDTDNISLQSSFSQSEKEENHYIPADYSVFDYTPDDNTPDIDVNAITYKLMKLNQAYPDLNVLSVFEMKYKQNITISEIAEKLSMDKNQVIMVLNKIIELV